ncbi:endonuclease/exonuclease/phosphatase family protein [Shimia sediminis]|uniref:endonuclease/exonuclease/phosphatase family protein n=1 Tax=Shimia sediminis TaxID=2497945 RepID=UPI000F8D80F6|nr:endonuclease/exonuclease/phosphatase family protein [Shimia sediminis]
MRLASFNVQNMRLRGPSLDGARDRDLPADLGSAAKTLDSYDRDLTADVLAEADADVVALQEVFDQATLDHFHDSLLAPRITRPYPYRYCLPGNDGRGLDIAVMSRQAPLAITSHADLTPARAGLPPANVLGPEIPIFRRDCLEVTLSALTLFICHFKAPYPENARTSEIRHFEALAVRQIIESRFADTDSAMWLVLGDLNEGRSGHNNIAPLRGRFSTDLMARLPTHERWSYYGNEGNFYAAPDVMLASPALAARCPDAVPRLIRLGLGYEATRHRGPRLDTVGKHRPHASDHAAVVIDLPL